MAESKHRLDETNAQLGTELWLIHSGLAIFRVIGLNASAIPDPGGFFGLVMHQSLSEVALGLCKVFEREKRHKLCSVSGVYRLTKDVEMQNASAAAAFLKRYGVIPSADWVRDIDQVFSQLRPWIYHHMRVIDRVRNSRFAHIQQLAPEGTLPSIAACEELLAFALDFHSFVNEAFLSVHSHPTRNDKQVESGLLRVLEMLGVTNPRSQFTDI
jgi:hypothetical protein